MQIIKVATFAEAQAARSVKINAREGALILDAQHAQHEPQHLIEKLLDGMPFIKGRPLDQHKWKPNPTLILVGKAGEQVLAKLEAVAPGLAKFQVSEDNSP